MTAGGGALEGWISPSGDGVLLRLLIQPKASRSEVVGPHGADGAGVRLKIRVAAPPVDGAANEELLSFLRERLGVPSSRLELVRGQASKQKDVLCRGISVEKAVAGLVGS